MPSAKMKADGDGDFDPDFSFDAGDDLPQPAWEFGGALKQALPQGAHGTSIDAKIQRRLAVRGAKADSKKRKREAAAAARRRGGAGGLSDDDSGSEEEEGSDDGSSEEEGEEESELSEEEDEPLPGELEEEEGSGMEEDDDSEDEEADNSDEEAAAAPAKQQQQQDKRKGKEAAAAKQQQNGKDAAAAKLKGKEKQQQKGKGAKEDQAAGKRKQQQQQQQQQQDDEEEGTEDEEEAPGAEARRRQQPGAGTSGRGGGAGGDGGDGGFYAATPEGTRYSAGSFADLQLSRPLLRAVEALGYASPTPIQAACVPLALAGRDICGSAVTGSGKTAAFALPILERLLFRPRQTAAIYVLILTPTRELAAQIHSMVSKLAQFTDISAALIVGGLSLQAQAAALRKGPEIIVATPGRIIDHLRNTQSFGLEDLAVLVLDEADRLLEMGFKEEVREIVRLAPRKRQTMLFSATFSEQVRDLMALSLKQPVRLAADAAAAAPKGLTQEVVRLKGSQEVQKEAILLALCARSFSSGRTIIFAGTKQRAHRLKILFGLCKLPPAGELHGDMTQAARLESLERFRSGAIAYLIATDVAARGLDIQGVEVVINFDAPRTLETYLHRIGRTARAGALGAAVTFAEDADRKLLRDVVKRGRAALRQRLVPAAAVAAWQGRVEKAEGDVQEVIREERAERELRRAEMEANKMQNMVDHEGEIYSRPARTWFQTEREKKALRDQSKAAAEGRASPGDAPGDARKKAGDAKSKKREKLKEKRAAEAEARKRGPSLAEETEEATRKVKSIKSKTRELQQQGLPASKAAKIAAAAVTGAKSSRQKKKPRSGEGLFSGDGLTKSSSGGGGGGTKAAGGGGGGGAGGGPKGKDKKGGLSKSELSRIKRGGKGKSAFKSKKKHKRR